MVGMSGRRGGAAAAAPAPAPVPAAEDVEAGAALLFFVDPPCAMFDGPVADPLLSWLPPPGLLEGDSSSTRYSSASSLVWAEEESWLMLPRLPPPCCCCCLLGVGNLCLAWEGECPVL